MCHGGRQCTMVVEHNANRKAGTQMPVDDANLIWIQDAALEYKRSRKWLDEQVALGRLSYATAEGDKRAYLLRSELDLLLRPNIRRAQGEQGAQGDQQVG